MRINISLPGNTVRFETDSRLIYGLLEKNYFLYASPAASAESNVKITPARRRLSKTAGEAVIKRFKGKIFIEREDFKSVSLEGLGNTELKVIKNRYSIDSWLRVFQSLKLLEANGLLLHASGYFHKNNAYIFSGASGRGKSTLIKLLGTHSSISDELCGLFKNKHSFFASSNPFWGELSEHKQGLLPPEKVKAIFFIEHSDNVFCKKLETAPAYKNLLRNVLFFDKSPDIVDKLVTICLDMAQSIPAYRLGFAMNTSKADILKILENA